MIMYFVRRLREQIFVGFKPTYYNDLSFLLTDNLFIAALEPFSMAGESYPQEKVTSWNWGSKIRSFL